MLPVASVPFRINMFVGIGTAGGNAIDSTTIWKSGNATRKLVTCYTTNYVPCPYWT